SSAIASWKFCTECRQVRAQEGAGRLVKGISRSFEEVSRPESGDDQLVGSRQRIALGANSRIGIEITRVCLRKPTAPTHSCVPTKSHDFHVAVPRRTVRHRAPRGGGNEGTGYRFPSRRNSRNHR